MAFPFKETENLCLGFGSARPIGRFPLFFGMYFL